MNDELGLVIGGTNYTMKPDGTWVPETTPTPVELATKSYVDSTASSTASHKKVRKWADAFYKKTDEGSLVEPKPAPPEWESIASGPLGSIIDSGFRFDGCSISTRGTTAGRTSSSAPSMNPYSKEALEELSPEELLELCDAVHKRAATFGLDEVLFRRDPGFIPYVNLRAGLDLIDRGTGYWFVALEIGDACYMGLGASRASATAELAYLKAELKSFESLEDVLELVNEYGIETVLGERLAPALVDEIDTGVTQCQ